MTQPADVTRTVCSLYFMEDLTVRYFLKTYDIYAFMAI